MVVRDCISNANKTAKVRVVLKKPAGLVEKEASEAMANGDPDVRWIPVDDREKWRSDLHGMYEWACDIKAAESLHLVAEWDIMCPAKR